MDKVKSGLYLILFGTLINSLPTILQKIDKIMKRVKAAYDGLVKILVSVKEAAQTFIQSVEENNNIIHEAADVFYHLIMYLEANDIKIEDVMEELNKRKK